jgi:hypothetical protein
MNEKTDYASWLERTRGVEFSPFGRKVANTLGFVSDGLWNSPTKRKNVNWKDQSNIVCLWYGNMSNRGGWDLAIILFECARKNIQLTISPYNRQYLKLTFSDQKNTNKSAVENERFPGTNEMIELYNSLSIR